MGRRLAAYRNRSVFSLIAAMSRSYWPSLAVCLIHACVMPPLRLPVRRGVRLKLIIEIRRIKQHIIGVVLLFSTDAAYAKMFQAHAVVRRRNTFLYMSLCVMPQQLTQHTCA
jgi:hypothetical protein